MDVATERSAEQLRGFAVLTGACALALASEPNEPVLEAVRDCARVLGDDRFEGIEPGGDLRQRFYDRLFVSSSPFFVPLHESSVARAREEGGRVRYGSACGPQADHALLCYRSVGFDYRRIEGFDLAVRQLRPGSMASELAFMSFLAGSAAEARSGDVDASLRAEALLDRFAREHPLTWFNRAAGFLLQTDDDLYARVCAFAAEATAAWVA